MIFAQNKRRKRGNAPKGNFAFRGAKASSKHSHILEFNPDTEASVRERRRVKRRRGFRMAVILITCMGLVALGRLVVKEAFINNERFHLNEFSVRTEGPLTPEQIISATGLHRGVNMLMISLTSVRDRLESLPEVHKVRVTRNYPGTLALEVEQRRPVAWLEASGQSEKRKTANAGCMLDADGVVLPDFNQGADGDHLPRITVEKLPHLVPGQPVDSTQVLAALHLLAAYQGTEMGRTMEMVSIDASHKYGLQASMAHSGSVITFGERDFDKQLRRLERIAAEASERHRVLATVNLLVEQNVPLTFREADTAAATASEKRVNASRRPVVTTN